MKRRGVKERFEKRREVEEIKEGEQTSVSSTRKPKEKKKKKKRKRKRKKRKKKKKRKRKKNNRKKKKRKKIKNQKNSLAEKYPTDYVAESHWPNDNTIKFFGKLKTDTTKRRKMNESKEQNICSCKKCMLFVAEFSSLNL